MKEINIAEIFSENPGLRNCNISENSGEEFYQSILNEKFKEAYENGFDLTVNLDNTSGYASSFLDEAFGNLVFDFTLDIVKKKINIISIQEPHWKDMIENKTYIQWEKRRRNKDNPKVTFEHKPWYRIINNELKLSLWEQPVV